MWKYLQVRALKRHNRYYRNNYWCSISSLNINACILWKLLNNIQHTGAQSATKTAYVHMINMKTAVPTPATRFILQGHHQKTSEKVQGFLSHGNCWYLRHFPVLHHHASIFSQNSYILYHSPFSTQKHAKEISTWKKRQNTLCIKYLVLQRQLLVVLYLKEMLKYMRPPYSQGPKCTGFLSNERIYLLNSLHKCPQ